MKWLSRIHVAASRPESLYTTRLYNRRVVVDGRPVSRPVRELDVHSMIVAHAEDVTLQAGAHEVLGWAWGAWPVRRVEVSTDGGATWAEAQLESRGPEPTWQRFALAWQVTAPGVHELRCRATDAEGREQPAEGRNRIHTVRVTVI